MGPLEAWELAKNFGLGALFLAMYLSTIGLLIKTLKEQQKDIKKDAERMTIAVEESAKAQADTATKLAEVDSKVTALKDEQSQYVAYLKGRDSR